MNNIELLKVLNDVDERFFTEEYQPKKNKRYRVSFEERVIRMKKLKYIFVPLITISAIFVITFIYRNRENENDKEEILKLSQSKDIPQGIEESIPTDRSETYIEDEIKINGLVNSDLYNIDAKWIDSNLFEKFEFLENLNIPENYNDNRQGEIYVRANLEDNEYKEFKQYSIMYSDHSEAEVKSIELNFSPNTLLKGCIPSNIENSEVSIINGLSVKLYVAERKNEPNLISGEAYLEYNDCNFDLKVYRLTQEEFIDIVKSLTISLKDNVFNFNDAASYDAYEISDDNLSVTKDENNNESTTKENYPECYGGRYIDENGTNVILVYGDVDSDENVSELSQYFGGFKENTVLKPAKYSYNYLTDLQNKISEAMINNELPFVTSSALMDDSNNIIVRVTTTDENSINKVKAFDTIGGAIEIKYNNSTAITE